MSLPRLDHDAYTIGWICALPKEMTAAIAMLDIIHDNLPQPASDHNNYCLGCIEDFNIVIAGLPSGDIGSHPASVVAIRMLNTFPNLNMGLMVGIGGGVPSREHDIRLGDVVVSIPANGFGGVVQHDMGKNTRDGGWVRTGSLNGPPSVLRTTISKLMSLHKIRGNKISHYLSEMIKRYPNLSDEFTRQETWTDILYEPEPEDPEAFQSWVQVQREPRQPYDSNKIHYGLIASGNQVIKSGRLRDQISARLGGVLCFEMEAAGLMNELPCIVVRGVCDYADAHKHKVWQEYAAAAAAAYTKELIAALPKRASEKHALHDPKLVQPNVLDPLAAIRSYSPDVGPHWIVPFSRNPHFVGREQELSTLQQWSASQETCQGMAVFGLGGVGKTQIALEFAYRIRETNPNCSVFWVSATDPLAFERGFEQIGRKINVPGLEANGADAKQLVKDALSDIGMGQWLMIIDNADDIEMVFRQPTDVEPITPALVNYIPSSPNGSTLITTRNRKVAVKQARKNIISLEIMGPGDARRLLEKSLLRQDILSDVDGTSRLLEILGCLPLAINHAAAYMNENDATIGEYTDLYNDSEIEVMKVLSEDFEVHGRYKTVKNSIAATWLISLSQIARTDPAAIDRLSLMACLSPHNISQSLLPPAPSKKQGLEAIGTLKAYSFIRKREDGASFDMHPLVHLASRNWLRIEGKLQKWTERALLRLIELLPDGDHEDRATWTAYLPHAKYLLTSATTAMNENIPFVVLAEKLAKCLYSNGEYSEAYQGYKEALALRIKASGLEDRDTLRNMFGMAEALNHQGEYKQAEYQHQEILELRKKVLGPKDPEVGRSLNYLAQAMYDGGRYAEAEQTHKDALALQREVLPPEHPNTLTTTGYLAQAMGKLGKYKEAEQIHRDLLQTRIRVAGETYPGTLATMSCLGVAQADLGRYAEAEETHRRVLALRVKVLGDRHPHTAITKRWLADALMHQAKHEEALRLNREALEVQAELLGAKHPNTILTLGNLGDILLSRRQYHQAAVIYREVVGRQLKTLGAEHPETLAGLNNLANALYSLGEHVEATELYARVFEARVRVLGPEHPHTISMPIELSSSKAAQMSHQDSLEPI